VLFEPEIPWNTGNIGRTCVAAGATLHLIKPLGFRLGGREIRRAGLDYWPRLRLVLHDGLAAFLASLPGAASVLVFTTKGRASFRTAPYRKDSFLLFGRESSGLPEEVMERFSASLYRIPVSPAVRSLNLSTAAALALYEGLRQVGLDP
jgi:tRNA (cytidine/uridine-2'-O-)-methyltransferase